MIENEGIVFIFAVVAPPGSCLMSELLI